MGLCKPTFVFVLLWFLCVAACFNPSEPCINQEKRALLDLKHGLSTSDFSPLPNSLSSWSNQTDCCNWRGVRCNNITGRVIALDLSQQFLAGNLTTSLLDMKFLSYLDLSVNDFNGSRIPSFLGSMTRLKYLDLSSSGFEGLIPHQLQNLSNIRYLNLNGNYGLYADNLNWLSHLQSLEFLDMSMVDLHKEVDWLRVVSNLPSLTNSHLYDCFLENMIPSLGHVNFSSLTILDVSFNNFNCTIPKWIFNLSSLQTLELSDNSLYGGIPDGIGKFKHLQSLGLGQNKLSGPIPESLVNLSSLHILDLSDNQLNGTLPKSIWVFSNLEEMDISYNLLKGIVSEATLTNLSKLKYLDLFGNSLSLNFSSIWVPSFQLEYLSISFCKMISPNFPLWLKTQTSLIYLAISQTGISGTVPNWFWELGLQMAEIDLSQNLLDGVLSTIMLNASVIDISSNRFSGQLPLVSSNVEILNLANNNFSGYISSLLCGKEKRENKLYILDVSYNFLSSELSDCWRNWQALMQVNMGNNNFSGEIPTSMGSLSGLQSLQLHDNKLVGGIPSSLKDCQYLSLINLSGKKFTGSIPSWIGHSSYLLALSLNSNKFTGSISQQICHLSSLMVLDLANNNLSGSIPKCLDNITEMVAANRSCFGPFDFGSIDFGYQIDYKVGLWLAIKGRESEYKGILGLLRSIDLSSNNLSGPIPLEISNLVGLNFLNLSHNEFVGKLPDKLGSMTNLEVLDLSKNDLSGEIPPSISNLTFLSDLNLSFNNLSGRIPLSTQLLGFNESGFMGNPGLCGPPLKKKCTKQEIFPKTTVAVHKDVEESELFGFYISIGLGFGVGFWGICGALFFKYTWRRACFQFLNHMRKCLCHQC